MQGGMPIERRHGQAQVQFLAQYNNTNGTPLRSAMFGHIHKLSRLAAIAPASPTGQSNIPWCAA